MKSLSAPTVVHKIITAPGGRFLPAPPGRFGGHPGTATGPTQNCGGREFSRPAGRSGGAARADPAIAPAAGLVGSGPRPRGEPNRATDGAPASPRTGRIWKNCAARRDRAPAFSHYGRRLDLGPRASDFKVRNPRLSCKKSQIFLFRIREFFCFCFQIFYFSFPKFLFLFSEFLFFHFRNFIFSFSDLEINPGGIAPGLRLPNFGFRKLLPKSCDKNANGSDGIQGAPPQAAMAKSA